MAAVDARLQYGTSTQWLLIRQAAGRVQVGTVVPQYASTRTSASYRYEYR